jgi:small ligand-binding sensory domain FIST
MKWASALSERPSLGDAVDEAAARLRADLDAAPDLVCAFVSAQTASGATPELGEALSEAFPGALVFGCTGGGVIGAGHEVEDAPALSLTAARLPGVSLAPFHLGQALDPDAPKITAAHVGLPQGADCALLVLADPFTSDTQRLLGALDAAFPTARKVGGLASGGRFPGSNALFLGEDTHRHGAVGVALSGDVRVDTLVAQGCRPIGHPMVVSRCDDNVIHELDNRTPIEVLRELHEELNEQDRQLFRHSLFVGLEMDEQSMQFRAEFLVRNLVGVDQKTGALAVGQKMRPWQVVQFLLRDARAAEIDLRAHLDRYREGGGEKPAGALLFSCLGRGKGLFGKPDHDTGLFQQRIGQVPLGGFFCNGEIGPVGGTTFLHGYTSAFGLFRKKRSA